MNSYRAIKLYNKDKNELVKSIIIPSSQLNISRFKTQLIRLSSVYLYQTEVSVCDNVAVSYTATLST